MISKTSAALALQTTSRSVEPSPEESANGAPQTDAAPVDGLAQPAKPSKLELLPSFPSTPINSRVSGNLGGTTIENWAGTWSSNSLSTFAPTTKNELTQILASSRGPLRFVGSAHSWSVGAKTDATLVNMEKLNRVLDFDPVNRTATVEVGIKMQDLYQYLDERGWALDSIPSSPKITLAGAMANGVHGSGSKYAASVSDHAVELEFLKTDGSGSLKLTDSSNIFTETGYTDLQLGRTHLGSVGALYSAKLNIVPKYDLDITREWYPREAVISKLPEIAAKHDQHLFFYFAGADAFLIQTFDQVPLSRKNEAGAPPFVTTGKISEPDPVMQAEFARLAATPNSEGVRQMHQRRATTEAPERTLTPWNVGFIESAEIQPNDVSYAVPPESVEPILNGLIALFAETGIPPVELWLRYVGQADSVMNPAFSGPKAMLEFFPMKEGDPVKTDEVIRRARAIFETNGGVRHWGKDGAGGVEKYPAQAVAAFGQLRQAADPHRRLASEFTREIGLDPDGSKVQ